MTDVYSIQWGKHDRHKILCNNKPVGQIISQPDHMFKGILGSVDALGPCPADALERVVRKLDPMAVVYTL